MVVSVAVSATVAPGCSLRRTLPAVPECRYGVLELCSVDGEPIEAEKIYAGSPK
jgi:hypothetical protein